MRQINLSEESKTNLLNQFMEKVKTELENFSIEDTTLSVKTNFNEVAKNKVTVFYTQEAFIKMQALVDYFDTEVAWYGLVQKVDKYLYMVYDVKVCKQYVDGAKVDTEDDDTLEFFSSLTDEEAEHMHFQAHSHVKMSTSASGVDMQNQKDVIKNMGKTGFYIFQIWNKSGDINTYLYDLDENIFYDRKDVIIEVEGVTPFIESVKELVTEKKKTYYPYQWTNFPQKKKEKEKEEETIWNGMSYGDGFYGRWDW